MSISVPEDLRKLLEGEGRRLDAIEIVVGTPTFAVITYRVDYGDWPSFEAGSGVIKFSKKAHAIPESQDIQLGSSRYYREHEHDTAGIADPEEARLVQRGPLSEFCRKNGTSSQPWFENVSSTVTWARPDFLMFCTSTMREGLSLGELWRQFPDYDCATFIPDPSAFAMQLGKDLGRQFDMRNVRLDGFDRIKQMALAQAQITPQGCLPKQGLDTVVLVSHGPVAYSDPPERTVNRFPAGRRGEVVPFVKRDRFSRQREYRFVVDTIGEPEETEFLMKITDDLRGLARSYSERG